MDGIPIRYARGMGYLCAVSQSLVPGSVFGNMVLTFDTNPLLCRFPPVFGEGKGLASMGTIANWMERMPCGGSTNFHQAMELLLQVILDAFPDGLKQLLVLIVWTDMQPDRAAGASRLETVFEATERMFAEAGVTMPLVVFWNLRGDTSCQDSLPTETSHPNVVYLSGFSMELLKDFFDMLKQGKFCSATTEAQESVIETAPNEVVNTSAFLDFIKTSEMYRKLRHVPVPSHA